MKKISFFVFLTIFVQLSNLYASMPVEVTITACVKEGVFTSRETDFGTHKVKRDDKSKIKVMDSKTRSPVDMSIYNNKEVRIKGYLLPGDLFFVDKNAIKVIGNCVKTDKLSLEEQEKLAEELFMQMSKADPYDTDLFIRLYTRVINECPDTERAQEAYWRLSNLYLQAFEKPDYERVVLLLEEAIKKYPNTPATPHYKKRLLFAYEETKQWSKAVKLYEEAIKNNPNLLSKSENSAFMIGYSDALSGSGDRQKALRILNKVLSFEGKIDDWLIDIVKSKIKELSIEKKTD